ncbi:hypothetical protein CKO38_16025 [Rhodospirillum rubrum]|uniref:hypothetical protein n=1 Tax=Rhodospirillum rubrum TaxID=1085 RepID=UPI0019076CB1|nr:hypothetical protein [Rhodospirillum rubrum]MBK1665458.1 hypothetical protein [Rhodospirillum rubrum]MBK1678151.1 hypothetical protein [Rhodospirillum rubrum]
MIRTLLVAAIALSVAGCSTYQREKADLTMGGGQSYRQQQAQERLDEARAKNTSMREEEEMARTELADVQAKLKEVQRDAAAQQKTLLAARKSSKITAARHDQLSRKLNDTTSDYYATALELQSAEAAGSTATSAKKKRELAELEKELKKIDAEISILAK